MKVLLTNTGLKIMASQRTMSGPDDHLFGQTFSWLVILTAQVHGFQVNNGKNKFTDINSVTKTVKSKNMSAVAVINSEIMDETPS